MLNDKQRENAMVDELYEKIIDRAEEEGCEPKIIMETFLLKLKEKE